MKGFASRSSSAAQSGVSSDIDFEGEHRPDVARRASNLALRRHIQKRALEDRQNANEKPQEAAARGIATATTSLPFGDQIQKSFGPTYDVSQIQAHVGGNTAAAMSANAYATGNHVVFDRSPDLHTAAHEAAHVVQQARGVNLYGGVGQAGDAYEQHADAVADRVVAGQSATDLLAVTPGGSSVTAIQKDDKHAAVGGQAPYLVPPTATAPQGFVKTGDPIADGGSCNYQDGPGCFLSSAQRAQVVTAFCTRVQDIQNVFHDAILSLRMDKLAESDADTSVFGTIVGIVFGIVTGWMGAALGAAMKTAASGAKQMFADAKLFADAQDLMVGFATAPELPDRFAAALTHVSPGAIDATTKGLSSIAASKVSAMLAIGAVDGDSKQTQKTQAVAYIDQIAQSTMDFYTNYRDGMLGSNDATLVVLTNAFKPAPRLADVKAQLSGKVEHFMSSKVPKIGRQVRNADRDVGAAGKPLMEMQVAWVVDMFTHSKRLAYFDRAFANPVSYDMGLKVRDDAGKAQRSSDWLEKDFYGGAGSPGFSLGETPNADSPMYPALESSNHFVGYVEDDLVDLALEHHNHAWLTSPETFYFNPAVGTFSKSKA